MTTELARQYCSDRTYYKVEIDSEIDNPDQRITEDVTSFTRLSLDFAITLLTSIIDLISFSGILYSIYPQLFYVIFVYASFGSITTVKLGRALVGQNAEQLPSIVKVPPWQCPRLLRLLGARLVALCSSALPGRGPGHWAPGLGLSCSSEPPGGFCVSCCVC